jgi:small subunit ribosomal protein S8
MMTDPIADMLTRIRNGNMAGKETVDIPNSKMKVAIAGILEKEGYTKGYTTLPDDTNQGILRVALKYSPNGDRVIHQLKRVSLPSRRFYVKATEIAETCGGLGISIISTSKGLMTGQEAKKRNLGGEIVCEVW